MIGYVGQIVPHKGVELLPLALRRLPHLDVEVRIYGDRRPFPRYAATLERLARGDRRMTPSPFAKIVFEKKAPGLSRVTTSAAAVCSVPLAGDDTVAVLTALRNVEGLLLRTPAPCGGQAAFPGHYARNLTM